MFGPLDDFFIYGGLGGFLIVVIVFAIALWDRRSSNGS